MVRYEILLPLRYNDGSPIERKKFRQTRFELLERFQAVSFESSRIAGLWIHGHVRYKDKLVRVFVDTDDTPEVEAFFRQFKETLKERFGQLDIWITAHSIRII